MIGELRVRGVGCLGGEYESAFQSSVVAPSPRDSHPRPRHSSPEYTAKLISAPIPYPHGTSIVTVIPTLQMGTQAQTHAWQHSLEVLTLGLNPGPGELLF